jgi:phage baseplate assembly protein V
MIEHIKRVVSEFMGNFTLTKYGQISAYNPNDYTVKVLILPNLTDETGFIPLSAPWVGNNFGAVFGPGIGDSVRLDFMDGRVEATVVGGRFFNNSARPPVVQSGQAAIVDSQGSYVKLNNDGTMTFNAATGMNFSAQTIVMQAAQTIGLTAGTEITNSAPQIEMDGQLTQGTGPQGGTATINGPATVNNDLTAQGKSVHNHTHLEHGAGSQTSPPT